MDQTTVRNLEDEIEGKVRGPGRGRGRRKKQTLQKEETNAAVPEKEAET